jgi:hypothetical protein
MRLSPAAYKLERSCMGCVLSTYFRSPGPSERFAKVGAEAGRQGHLKAGQGVDNQAPGAYLLDSMVSSTDRSRGRR